MRAERAEKNWDPQICRDLQDIVKKKDWKSLEKHCIFLLNKDKI